MVTDEEFSRLCSIVEMMSARLGTTINTLGTVIDTEDYIDKVLAQEIKSLERRIRAIENSKHML